MTKVMIHGCEHEFQDRKFGPYQRGFNQCASTGNVLKWRCTVCEGEVETAKKKDVGDPDSPERR